MENYRRNTDSWGAGIDILAVHHSDVPSVPLTSGSIQLLPSLLSPTFSPSLLHLTLHPTALLSHLHHAYSIENVGQHPSNETDNRVHEYLPMLHARHWGSPLHAAESASANAPDANAHTKDVGTDSPDPRDLLLHSLGGEGTSAAGSGRCCVEYMMRGLGKSNKRSEAAKMLRGLEGLQQQSGQNGESPSSTVCKDVSQILRIKGRTIGAVRDRSEEVSNLGQFSSSWWQLILSVSEIGRRPVHAVHVQSRHDG